MSSILRGGPYYHSNPNSTDGTVEFYQPTADKRAWSPTRNYARKEDSKYYVLGSNGHYSEVPKSTLLGMPMQGTGQTLLQAADAAETRGRLSQQWPLSSSTEMSVASASTSYSSNSNLLGESSKKTQSPKIINDAFNEVIAKKRNGSKQSLPKLKLATFHFGEDIPLDLHSPVRRFLHESESNDPEGFHHRFIAGEDAADAVDNLLITYPKEELDKINLAGRSLFVTTEDRKAVLAIADYSLDKTDPNEPAMLNILVAKNFQKKGVGGALEKAVEVGIKLDGGHAIGQSVDESNQPHIQRLRGLSQWSEKDIGHGMTLFSKDLT